MYTAQNLLNQPIILAVLAGLFILTAFVLFIAPTFSWLLEKIKPTIRQGANTKKRAPAKKSETPHSKASFLAARQIIYVLVAVAVVGVIAVGGWYIYTNFFGQKKEHSSLKSTPNYNYPYHIVGKVTKIDYESGTLVVNDQFRNKDYSLKKNALTKVFREEQEVPFSEIKKDDLVVVRSNANFGEEEVNLFEIDIIVIPPVTIRMP